MLKVRSHSAELQKLGQLSNLPELEVRVFGRNKKFPVLTATFCRLTENLRLAVEVMTGEPVRFVHADFNTCKTRIRIGQTEKEIHFSHMREDLIHFCLGEQDNPEPWILARFDKPGEVRVILNGPKNYPPYFEDDLTWRVGTSFATRWEEPLYPNASAS